jgi:hypothetical protein
MGAHGELAGEGKKGEGKEEARGATWWRHGEVLGVGEGAPWGCGLLVRSGSVPAVREAEEKKRSREEEEKEEREKKKKRKEKKREKIYEKNFKLENF